MTETFVPHGRQTQRAPRIAEIDILWLTAGLGCDGDTISITAATQPSIEDIVLGAIPGLPKVNLRNPVLARENGEEFLRPGTRPPRGPGTPSSSSSKVLSPMRSLRRKATGPASGPTRQAASPS